MNSLHGRVAILTGASRNIGAECARRLASEGASVVLSTRKSLADLGALAVDIRSKGGTAVAECCDVTKEDAVQRLVEATLKRFGRIDILVNNAVRRTETSVEGTSLNEWAENLAANVTGPFLLSRAVIPWMKQQKYGRILFFSGIAADLGIGAPKATVKAAVVGLTRGLAQELGMFQVTVNCIAPGLIDVERDDDRERPLPRREQPIGRMGTPSEVAALVSFVVSDAASYVTGQVLRVNGGAHFG